MATPAQQDRHRNLYEDPLAVLVWWYDLAIFAMMFPSNSIIVFLRKNLGYRLMRPWIFWAVAFFLWALSGIGTAATNALQSTPFAGIANGGSVGANSALSSAPVWIFAIGMLVLAYVHRRRGWALILREPDPVHTFSRGDSYLARLLPIPEWIIQRYVEPVIVFLIGLVFSLGFHWYVLGNWLMFSATCLAAIEALILEKIINTLLIFRDERIEATAMQEADAALARGKVDSTLKIGGLVVASPELARLRADRLRQITG